MELTHGNNYNRIEVLAPAGSLEICKAVINAGADAVYLGGDMFGARAYAGNLNNEEMLEALDYAHRAGRRIYLTVNTLLKHKEIEGQLISYIRPFYEHGLDAVIVQDLGVMRLIKKHFPDMDIHASTQMTQTGSLGAKLLWDMGAERVVTSREMTLTEIAQLHKDCPDMEIESFVHGAMCYCYSGQCLMSSFRGGRSGSRTASGQAECKGCGQNSRNQLFHGCYLLFVTVIFPVCVCFKLCCGVPSNSATHSHTGLLTAGTVFHW